MTEESLQSKVLVRFVVVQLRRRKEEEDEKNHLLFPYCCQQQDAGEHHAAKALMPTRITIYYVTICGRKEARQLIR